VVDARAARNFNLEFSALGRVCGAVSGIAKNLAGAVAQQYPSRFSGDVDDAATQLRVALDTHLAEVTFMSGFTGVASTSGDTDAFYAITAHLDLVVGDLAKTFESVYGNETGGNLAGLWKRNLTYLNDYTRARELKDKSLQKKVLGDIGQFSRELVNVLSPATKGRLDSKAMLKTAQRPISTLTEVINAETSEPAFCVKK